MFAKKHVLLLILMLSTLLLLLPGCTQETAKPKTTLTISAAASLKEPLTEINDLYSNIHHDTLVAFNFGGSGALMQQIEQGAPADIFFSASIDNMAELKLHNLVDTANCKNILSNDLVLIAPVNSPLKAISQLTDESIQKIAIGDPISVPAGAYAKKTLVALGLFNTLAPKLVFAKDVEQVLAYTATGNADAGFVYSTVAAQNSDVTIIAKAPENSHPPIIYVVAVIKGSKAPREAKEFWDFLFSPQAAEIFEKHGFRCIAR